MMRNLVTAFLAGLGVMFMFVAHPGPALAHDYPWCVQGRGVGVPGDCMYQTYGQCMASASGRGLSCNVNPRVAFRQSPGSGYPPSLYGHQRPYPGRYNE